MRAGAAVRLGGRNTEEARRDPITTAQGVPTSDTTVVITLATSATTATSCAASWPVMLVCGLFYPRAPVFWDTDTVSFEHQEYDEEDMNR